jgi:hypothetical protein
LSNSTPYTLTYNCQLTHGEVGDIKTALENFLIGTKIVRRTIDSFYELKRDKVIEFWPIVPGVYWGNE